jgi:hypothetical protein
LPLKTGGSQLFNAAALAVTPDLPPRQPAYFPGLKGAAAAEKPWQAVTKATALGTRLR